MAYYIVWGHVEPAPEDAARAGPRPKTIMADPTPFATRDAAVAAARMRYPHQPLEIIRARDPQAAIEAAARRAGSRGPQDC